MNSTKLKVAFQMENINNIKANKTIFNGDSTIALIKEAHERGFELYYYTPSNLTLQNSKVISKAQQILNISYTGRNKVELSSEIILDLSNMNIIWLRHDPPFNIAYLTSTYVLDYLISSNPHILVFNNPKQVRNYPEKIITHYFSEFMPKTLITRSKDLIYKFLELEKQIVIKPLYDARGNNIFLLTINDPNVETVIEHFLTSYNELVIVQKFLEKVYLGDKRVLIVDGDPLGVFTRIPQVGITSNIAKGGKTIATQLSHKETFISKTVGTFLKQHDILFAGIDIIDEQLTEVNITSPTGIRNYYEFSGVNLAINIWDKIVEKLKQYCG